MVRRLSQESELLDESLSKELEQLNVNTAGQLDISYPHVAVITWIPVSVYKRI